MKMRTLRGHRRWWVGGAIVASLGLAVPVALHGLQAGTAMAAPVLPSSGTVLQDSATGDCLADSPSNPAYPQNGMVYAWMCGSNNSFEEWQITQLSGGAVTFTNWAYNQCLESNAAGAVFSEGCTGGTAQEWNPDTAPNGDLGFCNVYTGFCLDSNSTTAVYADPGNGDANQSWVAVSPAVG
jgi:hypothetical protein